MKCEVCGKVARHVLRDVVNDGEPLLRCLWPEHCLCDKHYRHSIMLNPSGYQIGWVSPVGVYLYPWFGDYTNEWSKII
jgi:hypothetical protein